MLVILLLLLLLKPAAQAQVGKTKLFINCFRNPTSTCTTENWKKTIQGRNQWSAAPLNLSTFWYQTQCREGYSTQESGQAGNTLQIGTFYTLILRNSMVELRPQRECVEHIANIFSITKNAWIYNTKINSLRDICVKRCMALFVYICSHLLYKCYRVTAA